MPRRVLLAIGFALLATGCSELSGGEGPGRAGDPIREAIREPDSFARAARLATLLPTLGPNAVPEARAALEDRTIDLGFADILLLVRFWATHEPQAATEWSWQKVAAGLGVGPLMEASELWARVDPAAVLAKIQAVGPGPTTLHVEKALVRGWLASDLPGLEDYMLGLGGVDDAGQRALRTYTRERIRWDGPEAVMRWAESIPDEPWRTKLAAYRQVAVELGLADTKAAARWCEAHCQEERFGSSLLQLTAEGWALHDGPGAMEFLSTVPPSKERDRAVRRAVASWQVRDKEGAIAWMEARGVAGVEPWLEPGIYTHALSVGQLDPARGIEWAAAIEPEEARQDAYVLIAHWWHGKDREAAEVWLQQSPLSEEDRERVRAPILRHRAWVDLSEPAE
jgi:hypothetical protein